jgi:hypothetical protein
MMGIAERPAPQVVVIADHDPRYAAQIDAVRDIMGAPV